MESIEIQFARMDERMKMILDRLDEEKESQTKTSSWMQRVDSQLGEINYRVTNVEESLAMARPTIDEFIKIKHKITGAGVAGKWLWAGLGVLLGLVISAKDFLFRFFVGNST